MLKVPPNLYAAFKWDCISQRFPALHLHWKAVKSSLDIGNEALLKYKDNFTQDKYQMHISINYVLSSNDLQFEIFICLFLLTSDGCKQQKLHPS